MLIHITTFTVPLLLDVSFLISYLLFFETKKEGQPRYASPKWVEELSKVVKASNDRMELAAHLCGQRVNDVLVYNKDAQSFLSQLRPWGFHRVQINATAVNGVDTSNLHANVDSLACAIRDHPELEFILQKNEETRPLWEGLLLSESFGGEGKLLNNVVMLVDESKGTGVLASSWPTPPEEYDIGYAGGIGPKNVKKVLEDIMDIAAGRDIWIDMESSLRTKVSVDGENENDVFDLGKCFQCIEIACALGLFNHPANLNI